MVRAKHNAEGFHYVVRYRRADLPSHAEHAVPVHDWQESKWSVGGQETFRPYEISVEAVNSVGAAGAPPVKKIGYSGEDGSSFI